MKIKEKIGKVKNENICGKYYVKSKRKVKGSMGISPSYPCDTGIRSKHSILLFIQLL
jgi:hypothetical protein